MAKDKFLPGWSAPVLRLDSVASTQDVARKMAQDGARDWTLVIADKQTSGRGRMGRTWISSRGGLYMSVILRPNISPRSLGALNGSAADAVARALTAASGLKTAVKPPNDVLAAPKSCKSPSRNDLKKVCGILLEASGDSHRTEWAIFGIGVNVNNLIPPGLPQAASLRQLAGREFDLSRVCEQILRQFQKHYEKFLLKESHEYALQ